MRSIPPIIYKKIPVPPVDGSAYTGVFLYTYASYVFPVVLFVNEIADILFPFASLIVTEVSAISILH